ncbi:MAG: BON domain-containing protein [Leptolyngbyaceae cyanobacterium bins.59]|nr:BON domain-containing protein [Leptolyngbyaceae cyanobacterium bins.59]
MSVREKPLHVEKRLEKRPILQSKCVGSRFEPVVLERMFTTIPPERTGVNGEYDYHGLAKRVALALSQKLQLSEVANLHVSQRGRVVILKGEVPNRRVLQRIIHIAKEVPGTLDVEIHRILFAA